MRPEREGTDWEDDDSPTLRASGVRPVVAQPVRSSAAPTPQQTLGAEELDRSRAFVRIVIGLALVIGLGSLLVPSSPWLRTGMVLGVATALGASLWLTRQMRHANGYTARRAHIAAELCSLASLGGIAFFGAFSPAVVILPFGPYFFSLGGSERAVYAQAASSGVGYALLVLATHLGWLPEGLVGSGGLDGSDKLVVTLLVEAVLVATVLAARATRSASLRAVERHDRMVRRLAHREVLLSEARENLERALQRGGVGRYTDEVLGSYRLGAVIGHGAMGEVYEAYGVDVPEAAAVKVLIPELLRDPAVVRRFMREARLCATLKVPNVVRVYQIGGLEAATPYIAMERLYGRDLDAHLHERGRLGVREVVELCAQVGCALDAASAAGIVHRDIKPTNLFLAELADNQRIWKVLDFGVAKLTTTRGTLTQGRIVGTPAYMAPEQASGVVTHLSISTLGVICYRAITGHAPFRGETFADTLYRLMATMPPRPGELVPELPPEMDAVLAVAMAKEPTARFRSAQELAEALDTASRGELDERVRSRATSVLLKHPWGERSGATVLASPVWRS